LDFPDTDLVAAYQAAAGRNVLAALNPDVFPGYWSVCADGIGHGFGNTYPALDGHQMTDALLWLGRIGEVQANWDYVRSFQRPDGQLPFAILPALAGQPLCAPGDTQTPLTHVDANGGLYQHWVPNNPLRALGYPTYVQNADAIFRHTRDLAWLRAQLPSINLALAHLTTMISDEGLVGGAGYYVERPTRVEYDGVTQCHACEAFQMAAELNALAGEHVIAAGQHALAERLRLVFQSRFWNGRQFIEYFHPQRGAIAGHGLTDVDWSAIALGLATPEQRDALWPLLRNEPGFYYGGMPTGIAAHPAAYEDWEFSFNDRMDLAAMGRVWYIEARARAAMGDAAGLFESIRRVVAMGARQGYDWDERYNTEGGFGVTRYCEYPANLIRIMQRFALGITCELDGSLSLAPTVLPGHWAAGFGQTLHLGARTLSYRFAARCFRATYSGPGIPRLSVRMPFPVQEASCRITLDGQRVVAPCKEGRLELPLAAASADAPCQISVIFTD
jgi:hypothetical protein